MLGGAALDVACGTGELARLLKAMGYTVDAVDYASTAIGRATRPRPFGARQCADSLPLTAKERCAHAPILPFPGLLRGTGTPPYRVHRQGARCAA
ncbi:methyltransferase domain-containing protein [Streptomyces sp. NPDC005151]